MHTWYSSAIKKNEINIMPLNIVLFFKEIVKKGTQIYLLPDYIFIYIMYVCCVVYLMYHLSSCRRYILHTYFINCHRYININYIIIYSDIVYFIKSIYTTITPYMYKTLLTLYIRNVCK